jgi:hypothetical protein
LINQIDIDWVQGWFRGFHGGKYSEQRGISPDDNLNTSKQSVFLYSQRFSRIGGDNLCPCKGRKAVFLSFTSSSALFPVDQPHEADIVWAFDQIDDAYRAALKVTPKQYVNQFPFEACLVMKHHLADTVKQVSGGNTAGRDPSKHVKELNRTDACWDWMRGLAAEQLRSMSYTSPC